MQIPVMPDLVSLADQFLQDVRMSLRRESWDEERSGKIVLRQKPHDARHTNIGPEGGFREQGEPLTRIWWVIHKGNAFPIYVERQCSRALLAFGPAKPFHCLAPHIYMFRAKSFRSEPRQSADRFVINARASRLPHLTLRSIACAVPSPLIRPNAGALPAFRQE